MSNEEIKAKEELQDEPWVNSTSSDGSSSSKAADEEKNILKSLNSKIKSGKNRVSRRKKIIVGSFAGIITGITLAITIVMAPMLRLEHYFQNINQRAFALASTAVEARLGHLMERYMVSYVINLDRCTQVQSINCRAPVAGQGLTAGMFQAWRDVRIEQRLFDHFGLEIETRNNPEPGQSRHVLRDRRGSQVRAQNGRLVGGPFEGGRREFGRELNRFLRSETKWHQVMQRRGVRKYAVRKHNIQFWCFFACATRDNIGERTADAKTRYRYRFIERFVYPFSGKLGLYLDCISTGASGSRCSTRNLRSQGIDRARIPDDEATRIIRSLQTNPNQRLTTFAIQELAFKLFQRQLSQRALSAIPIAGQVYLGLWAFNLLDNLDQALDDGKLGQFAADINSRQYVEYYQATRSDNDAFKVGELSIEELGVLATELEGAEESRVWKAYNNDSSIQTAALGSGVVSAASHGDDEYLCQNDEPIPAGELVCEEKKVARTFAVEEFRDNTLVDFGATAIFGTYRVVAKPIVDPVIRGVEFVADLILGSLLRGVFSILQNTPGISTFMNWLQEKGAELFQWILEKLFPLPVQADSPGREKYDALEAGADVAANEFAQGGFTDSGEPYGLGAEPLSDEEVAEIYSEFIAQQEYEYSQSSWFTKVSSLEHQNSVASRMLRDMPATPDRTLQSIALAPINTLAALTRSGASYMFKPVFAQQSASQQQVMHNAFGITRHGYRNNHPALTANPETITPQYCEQRKQQWEDSMTENEATGFEEYSVANPCLLEITVIESAGGLFMDTNYDYDGLLDAAGGNN